MPPLAAAKTVQPGLRRGLHVFLSPARAVVKVLFILAPLLFEGRPPRPLPLERQRTQPLAPRAGRPDGCHTPLCAEGAGPYGNTGKHRPADWYLMPSISLTILTEILRFAQDDSERRGSPIPDTPSGLFYFPQSATFLTSFLVMLPKKSWSWKRRKRMGFSMLFT